MLCSGIDANEHIQWCSSVHTASCSLLVCCCLVFVGRISWACKPFHHFILLWCHCSAKKVTFWNIVMLRCVRIPKEVSQNEFACVKEIKTAANCAGNGFVRSDLSYKLGASDSGILLRLWWRSFGVISDDSLPSLIFYWTRFSLSLYLFIYLQKLFFCMSVCLTFEILIPRSYNL